MLKLSMLRKKEGNIEKNISNNIWKGVKQNHYLSKI